MEKSLCEAVMCPCIFVVNWVGSCLFLDCRSLSTKDMFGIFKFLVWWHAGNAGQDWTPCRNRRKWMSADIWEHQGRSARAGIQVICSWSHRRDISMHTEHSEGHPDIWNSRRLQLSYPHLNDVHRRGVKGGFGILNLSQCTGCKGAGQETQLEKPMDPAGKSAVCLLL